jgi:uncharacterized protein (DUF1697 family)
MISRPASAAGLCDRGGGGRRQVGEHDVVRHRAVTTHVAFLRAVNLGKRTVKMPRLVEIFEQSGFPGAWTYINSGNVVFEANGPRSELEARLDAALEQALGFEATTFVRSAAELRRAVAAKPFPVAAGDTYFVTFLKSIPSAAPRRALEALSNDFDTLTVVGRDVHWRMRGKSTDTRLPTKDWDAVVGRHRSTSRNMTMLRKLMEKIS